MGSIEENAAVDHQGYLGQETLKMNHKQAILQESAVFDNQRREIELKLVQLQSELVETSIEELNLMKSEFNNYETTHSQQDILSSSLLQKSKSLEKSLKPTSTTTALINNQKSNTHQVVAATWEEA